MAFRAEPAPCGWLCRGVIDNQSHQDDVDAMTLSLDQLPFRTLAVVAAIDWPALSEADSRRLRNLGFDEGVEVEALHGAPFGGDPLAVRVGRMMVAVRRAQAQAISVSISVSAAAMELAAE
jgi:ferrous iron transport protein A